MTKYNKLRIFWIDDREGDNPKYQYPQPELPKEYEPYFEIIRHAKGGLSSVRNPQEFSAIFGPFWAGVPQSAFPAEIIAMDYVLSKWSPEEILPLRDEESEDEDFRQIEETNRSAPARTETPKGGDNGAGDIASFEGLLIGVFYASLTCDYPAGLVPMTNYGDQMEKVQEVRALHAMSKPLLDVDYSKFGVSGEARSWRNVLSQGLKSLRYRITSLFLSRRIILSLADIVAANGAAMEVAKEPEAAPTHLNDAVITIHSTYGTRRLPIAGLFADLQDIKKRASWVIDWTEELLSEAGDTDVLEPIPEARAIAKQHWSDYLSKSDAIEQRWLLSELCASKKYDASFSNEATLKHLIDSDFKASGSAQSPKEMWKDWSIGDRSKVINVCDVSKDGLVVRWASVFVLARLIAHLMRAQLLLNGKSAIVSGSCFSHFCSRDWLYALMPSPESPLILPAHHKGHNNPASSGGTLWRKLRRLNSAHLPVTADDNIGNCGIDCEHVFAGKAKDGSDLGLRPVERRLLEAAVMDHLVEAGMDAGELKEFRAKLPLPLRTILREARA